MTEPMLTMDAPGASEEQVRRGVEAAEAVFARHGTTADETAEALSAREQDEMMGAFIPPELVVDGGPPPEPVTTNRQMQIADVWLEADEAAVNACYAGARERPAGAQLVLLREEPGAPSLH